MPRQRDRGRRGRAVTALVVLSAAVLLLAAGAHGADEPSSGAAGWESLLGDRPSAQLGGRWIVVLAKPSLASRVAAAGGVATEEEERAWTVRARRDQRNVLARLAFEGAPVDPEHSYVRVLNGFAAPLDPQDIGANGRDGYPYCGYPVRTVLPAAATGEEDDILDVASGRRP